MKHSINPTCTRCGTPLDRDGGSTLLEIMGNHKLCWRCFVFARLRISDPRRPGGYCPCGVPRQSFGVPGGDHAPFCTEVQA